MELDDNIGRFVVESEKYWVN